MMPPAGIEAAGADYNDYVRALRSKLLLAFDAASVSGAVVSWGLGGLKVRSLARAPLAPGLIAPSPTEPNVADNGGVKAALEHVRRALAPQGRRAVLIAPDGIARTLLLDIPAGVSPLEYARFRLAHGLPYPASEAVVDVLPLSRGRLLAAAVRRAVIEGYETVSASAGFDQERLDLAPLAALAGLLSQPARSECTVDLILGDAAFSVAVSLGGAVRVFRTRRRDPGLDDAQRLRDEVDRTAVLAGNGPPRLRVVGSGAREFIRALSAAGQSVEPGWDMSRNGLPVEAAELAWLGAARG